MPIPRSALAATTRTSVSLSSVALTSARIPAESPILPERLGLLSANVLLRGCCPQLSPQRVLIHFAHHPSHWPWTHTHSPCSSALNRQGRCAYSYCKKQKGCRGTRSMTTQPVGGQGATYPICMTRARFRDVESCHCNDNSARPYRPGERAYAVHARALAVPSRAGLTQVFIEVM